MKLYYEREGIEIWQGDCLEVMPNISPANLIVTDPPYGINYSSRGGPRCRDKEKHLKTAIAQDLSLNPRWFTACCSALIEKSAIYSFCNFKSYCEMTALIKDAGFKIKTPLVWNKGNHGMGDLRGDYGNRIELCIYAVKGRHILNGSRDGNLLSFQRPSDAHRLHPTQKPVDLLLYLIEKSSVANEIVLDPFLGSGSTLVACVKAGRRGVGIELSEEYCEIAAKRVDEAIEECES